ncbi:hypothetical protein [Cohnella sp. WQ 127256]|uniref:hypothetical protein n=1 Tax=Cohnella sp. WQ 127256 TaxID=2938790 RepID=UPI00211775BB|nr:hypothetical protein [Cohnella sp. WQ 127256]
MLKYRSWLIGFGLGIMIGASMLQLILFAQDTENKVKQVPMTQEQLNEEAKSAGLKLLTEEQLNTQVEEAVAAALKEAKIKSDEISLEQNKDLESASPSESTPSEQPSINASPDPKSVTLYVSYGMSLTEVAEELKSLGIIDDTEDFIVKAKDIAKKMKVGNAVFTGKPTYKQIMNELTRKK